MTLEAAEIGLPEARDHLLPHPGVQQRRRLPASDHGGYIYPVRFRSPDPRQRLPPLGTKGLVGGAHVPALQIPPCLSVPQQKDRHLIRTPTPQCTR